MPRCQSLQRMTARSDAPGHHVFKVLDFTEIDAPFYVSLLEEFRQDDGHKVKPPTKIIRNKILVFCDKHVARHYKPGKLRRSKIIFWHKPGVLINMFIKGLYLEKNYQSSLFAYYIYLATCTSPVSLDNRKSEPFNMHTSDRLSKKPYPCLFVPHYRINV